MTYQPHQSEDVALKPMAADTFPEGWKSAAERPDSPGWYERRYSDGTYAHHWSGSQWSSTKDGNAHWRQLADAPYPLWRPIPKATGDAS